MKMKNTVKSLVINCASFPNGINACIVLNTSGMHYCGYLELPESLADGLDPMYDLDVHGGVTYDELKDDKRIVGFDCSHSCDYTLYKAEWHKSYASHHMFPTPLSPPTSMSAMHFRTQTYVIKELRRMVASLEEFHIRKSRS